MHHRNERNERNIKNDLTSYLQEKNRDHKTRPHSALKSDSIQSLFLHVPKRVVFKKRENEIPVNGGDDNHKKRPDRNNDRDYDRNNDRNSKDGKNKVEKFEDKQEKDSEKAIPHAIIAPITIEALGSLGMSEKFHNTSSSGSNIRIEDTPNCVKLIYENQEYVLKSRPLIFNIVKEENSFVIMGDNFVRGLHIYFNNQYDLSEFDSITKTTIKFTIPSTYLTSSSSEIIIQVSNPDFTTSEEYIIK